MSPNRDQAASSRDGDAPTSTFESEIWEACRTVQTRLSDGLAEVGLADARPPELIARLGLTKSIAYMVARALRQTDPLEVPGALPGRNAIRTLLGAMKKAGAPASSLHELREAFAGYDEIVAAHCGDPKSLPAFLAANGGPGSADYAALMLSNAFDANSFVHGVQARVQTETKILALNHEDPGFVDWIAFGGLVDFRRIRSSVTWPIWQHTIPHSDRGEPVKAGPRTPLVLGQGELARAGVFTDFASVKELPLRVITSGDNTYYVVTEGPVGNKESLTCFLGHTIRHVGPVTCREDHTKWEVGTRIVTPVRRLVFDLYVHRSLRASETLGSRSYTELFGPMPRGPERLSWSTIQVPAQISQIPHGTRLPEVPRHLEMTERVFETVDLDPADFQLFRAELAHPPIHSIFFYEFEALRER